ncbi:MAG: hypothetical protein GC200_04005 [Tepidisphaera sp.]|nr:hypothetical protein [Tepidisphaera sp.]
MKLHTPRALTLLFAAGLAASLTAAPALAFPGDDDCQSLHARWPAVPDAASPAKGFDAATGRDTRHYPPHPLADFKHMLLELTIPDMNTPRFSATETLTLAPTGNDLYVLPLNARSMTISAVSCDAAKATFKYTDNATLEISFDPALPAGKDASVRIDYNVTDPQIGLTWTPESPAWPGRPAQLHSQGQPETNSYWFPCHDFPNIKLTTEIIATVPAGFTVLSNGHLAEHAKSILPGDDTHGMTPVERFHWVQDKPHVPYLVSLIVGKFDIVDVGGPSTARPNLPMPVYAPLGRGSDVAATFGRTPDMVALNEKLFNEPYAWDKYSQAIVWNFASGGMENTSCTTLYDTAILSPDVLNDHDLDGLISHELGHQWFGDLATCNSWEHIWLNEGFATYLSDLWMEHRDGRDAYLRSIRGHFDGIINADHADAPQEVGMCSKAYNNTWEPFRRAANPYGKGASILHMLRCRLGDDLFFKGVHEYLERRKFKTAETADLRMALEDVSGESLEQFFSQWCTRPGVPHVTITTSYKDGTLTLSGQQTQRLDGDNPAFEFDLPFIADSAAGASVRGVLQFRGKQATAAVSLPGAPRFVALNPDLTVLSAVSINQSEASWLAQLAGAPTTQAKIDAARGLAAPGDTSATVALRTLAQTASAPVELRQEAAKTLADRGDLSDLRSLITTCPDSWEVREAAVNALASMVDSGKVKPGTELALGIAEQVTYAAGRDKSLKVRCATVRLVGKLKPASRPQMIADAFATDSFSDELRQAAVDAAKSLDSEWALNKVLTLTDAKWLARLREQSTRALGSLGKHNPDKALARLGELLNDPELRTRRAAGEALVELGDAKAKPMLQAQLKSSRTMEWTELVNDWIKQLDAKAK